MDVLLFRALSLLGLAILVALAARRLRLPYTVGLVLAGAALAATRSNAGLALTHDLIFDVVLPPLLFEAALNLSWSDLQTRSCSGGRAVDHRGRALRGRGGRRTGRRCSAGRSNPPSSSGR